MKKIIILALGIMGYFQSFGQNAEVVNAFNYQRNKELAKAKMAIDKAALNDETSIKPKTWYYRGNIYMDIDINQSQDSTFNIIDKDALTKSLESYSRVIEIDTLKKQYNKEIINKVKYLQIRFANSGIEYFQKKNFNEALLYFETSAQISERFLNKIDTSLIYNASLAALNAKSKVKQKEFLLKLIALKYSQSDIYSLMSKICLEEKDTTKAIEYLTMGREAFPNNNAFMTEELNIYIISGKISKMIDKIKTAVSLDPKNPNLYFILGNIFDTQKKKDSAEFYYLIAIKSDSNYYDAYYNLGAMHYNTAVEIFNKTNDLPMSKEKEYNAGKLKYTKYFNKALPYLERAYLIDPYDLNSLNSLKEIYAKTSNFKKVGELKVKLEKRNNISATLAKYGKPDYDFEEVNSDGRVFRILHYNKDNKKIVYVNGVWNSTSTLK